MKIACLAVAASVLAGLALYGGVLGIYRFAHALSLPLALTNLLPLAVPLLLGFVAWRLLKYLQRRAEHRSVSAPLVSGGSNARDEERRQAWLQIKAKGRRRYVWRTGVVGWGFPVFAIFTPLMLILGPRTHQLSLAEITGTVISSFLVWMIGGYLFGRAMWSALHKKYR
jgi:hypothetical protein